MGFSGIASYCTPCLDGQVQILKYGFASLLEPAFHLPLDLASQPEDFPQESYVDRSLDHDPVDLSTWTVPLNIVEYAEGFEVESVRLQRSCRVPKY